MNRTRDISYQLEIEITSTVTLRVGALGNLTFTGGRYFHTGSARRAIGARIARHLCKEKKIRWHIDYLLAQPGIKVVLVRRSARVG